MALTAVGWGKHTLRNTSGNIYPVRAGGFTLSKEITSENILGYPVGTVGTQQPITTTTTETIWTVAMETGSVNDATMPYLFDAQFATAANLVLPRQQVVTVPATSPYTVTVTGLVENENVSATVLDAVTAPGDDYLSRIAAASVASIVSGEFAVTANTLTFHSAQAGKAVLIGNTRNNVSLADVIGGNTAATPVGAIQIFGALRWLASASEWNFWAPNASISDNLEFGSEVDAITMTFTLGSVDGWGLPFVLWKPPA